MIKSPLRYPGGKSRAISIIAKLIPYFDEYREPFLGGGSVFIYAKQRFPNKLFRINDLYYDLFTFWKSAQDYPKELVEKIIEWRKEFPDGHQFFNFLNENKQYFNELETAAAFFSYNRITFSGTTLSGGFSESAFKDRFTDSSIERLKSLESILKDTFITNSDYEEILKIPGNNVFIFLDPPYFSATKSALYGKNGNMHTSFDHERFASVMKNCPHKWLITYDDCDYIRKLFSFATIIPWSLTYGMRNITKDSDQKGHELFISNYLKNEYSISDSLTPTLF